MLTITDTYLDDSAVLKYTGDKNIISKLPVFPKNIKIVARYFNVPLRVFRTFGPAQRFKLGDADFKPTHIYKTDRHIIITPNRFLTIAGNAMFIIQALAMILIFLLLLLLSLAFGPTLLFISVMILIHLLVSSYLFLLKKSYILVGPLESIDKIDPVEKIISIKGRFNTGYPSFLTKDVEAELYLGEAIDKF